MIIKTISEIKKNLNKQKNSGKKIAFVPTMGALHDGHLALIKMAQKLADVVVVSIFVNQTQFNNADDYKNYPRQDEKDLEKLKNQQVDYIFLPSDSEIFNSDFSFKIIPTKMVDCLCAKYRPGHFEGVALIITKLFNIVKPDIAIFGEKDFQQLAIIKKLAIDLNFDVEIFAHKTVREKTGLAMSSRNQLLSQANKIKAAILFETLHEIKKEIKKKPKDLAKILLEKSQFLVKNGFEKIDYLEIRDENNLQLISEFNAKIPARIFVAAFIGKVRLIDNLRIN
ncbi:MAG: pantoate--beta-alanine ligase [Rickettsiales bacterium]|nr:pantoate--beta-alanine ligase [Rickettsiales bacterium]